MVKHPNWRRLVPGILLAAVVAGLLIALFVRRSMEPTTRAPKSMTRTSPAPRLSRVAGAEESPRLIEPAVAEGDTASSAPAARLPVTAPPAPRMPVMPRQPPARPSADTDMLAAAREAILLATPEALVTGEPTSWSAGDLHGYVVPGAEQRDAEQVCRLVYATTITGQDQRQGKPQRWCRATDEKGWAPE